LPLLAFRHFDRQSGRILPYVVDIAQTQRSCGLADNSIFKKTRNQLHESACLATAKGRGVDRCLCIEQDDQSWHASVSENLKGAEKWRRVNPIPIYSTTPRGGLGYLVAAP
jgi:hypothetical protein